MQTIKTKTIRRGEWTRVTGRAFSCLPFDEAPWRGEAALLRIRDVRAPLFVTTAGGARVCVADKGYDWLQIAPEGGHWWLTTMFDEGGRIVQYYFDITLENTVRQGGGSSFRDLFLDVVLTPDAEAELLDADELESALRDGLIDPAERETAYAAARALIEALPAARERLAAFCRAQRTRLIPLLKEAP